MNKINMQRIFIIGVLLIFELRTESLFFLCNELSFISNLNHNTILYFC